MRVVESYYSDMKNLGGKISGDFYTAIIEINDKSECCVLTRSGNKQPYRFDEDDATGFDVYRFGSFYPIRRLTMEERNAAISIFYKEYEKERGENEGVSGERA